MLQCRCLVQAGQTPDQHAEQLRAQLSGFLERSFGESVDIGWVPIAPGSGFTAGAPSTSSVVAITASRALEQEARADLLSRICDLWIAETGCTLNEIVAVISDPPAA